MKTLSLILLFLVFPSGCMNAHDKSRAEKAAIEYYASLCSEHTCITDGTGTMLIGDSNTYALPADILPLEVNPDVAQFT